MKKIILIIATTILSFSQSYSQEKLIINSNKSVIKWSSELSFYFGGHNGTVNFKEGYFIKTNDKITGGNFIIDMNTIVNVDGGYNEGLVNHLKDPDFFDVKKHPTAELEITEVIYSNSTDMRIKANLTIKKIKQPIRFNAKVDFNKSEMKTRFKIDRTRWGVNYNSKIKDDAISDAIEFEVKLNL